VSGFVVIASKNFYNGEIHYTLEMFKSISSNDIAKPSQATTIGQLELGRPSVLNV
jgi:hypothetical protein